MKINLHHEYCLNDAISIFHSPLIHNTHYVHSICRRTVHLRRNIQRTDGETHKNRCSIFRAVLRFYRWLVAARHLGYDSLGNFNSLMIITHDLIKRISSSVNLCYTYEKWVFPESIKNVFFFFSQFFFHVNSCRHWWGGNFWRIWLQKTTTTTTTRNQ